MKIAIVRDIITVVGLGCISYGSWLIYPAAGFIVFGVLVLTAAVVGVPRKDG